MSKNKAKTHFNNTKYTVLYINIIQSIVQNKAPTVLQTNKQTNTTGIYSVVTIESQKHTLKNTQHTYILLTPTQSGEEKEIQELVKEGDKFGDQVGPPTIRTPQTPSREQRLDQLLKEEVEVVEELVEKLDHPQNKSDKPR